MADGTKVCVLVICDVCGVDIRPLAPAREKYQVTTRRGRLRPVCMDCHAKLYEARKAELLKPRGA